MRYIHLRVEMIKLSELRQKRMELMEQIEEIKGKNKKSADQQPQIINSEYSGGNKIIRKFFVEKWKIFGDLRGIFSYDIVYNLSFTK